MSEPLIATRGGLLRLGALGIVTIVNAAAVVVIAWLTSGWQVQLNHYWESQTAGSQPGDPKEVAMEKLSTFTYQLSDLIGPLAVGALVALFVSLAALGFRWAKQHPLKP